MTHHRGLATPLMLVAGLAVTAGTGWVAEVAIPALASSAEWPGVLLGVSLIVHTVVWGLIVMRLAKD
jgi:predicted membrane-bound spermidine synthase